MSHSIFTAKTNFNELYEIDATRPPGEQVQLVSVLPEEKKATADAATRRGDGKIYGGSRCAPATQATAITAANTAAKRALTAVGAARATRQLRKV